MVDEVVVSSGRSGGGAGVSSSGVEGSVVEVVVFVGCGGD